MADRDPSKQREPLCYTPRLPGALHLQHVHEKGSRLLRPADPPAPMSRLLDT